MELDGDDEHLTNSSLSSLHSPPYNTRSQGSIRVQPSAVGGYIAPNDEIPQNQPTALSNSQLQDHIAALTVPGQALPISLPYANVNTYLPPQPQQLASQLQAAHAAAYGNLQAFARPQLPQQTSHVQETLLNNFEHIPPPLYSLRDPSKTFWKEMQDQIESIDFKQKKRKSPMPVARIRKIMLLDEDVNMIGGEIGDLFGMACCLFIREVAVRAWENTLRNKRKTLTKDDIASAVSNTRTFDFLIDIVPSAPKMRTYNSQFYQQQPAQFVHNTETQPEPQTPQYYGRSSSDGVALDNVPAAPMGHHQQKQPSMAERMAILQASQQIEQYTRSNFQLIQQLQPAMTAGQNEQDVQRLQQQLQAYNQAQLHVGQQYGLAMGQAPLSIPNIGGPFAMPQQISLPMVPAGYALPLDASKQKEQLYLSSEQHHGGDVHLQNGPEDGDTLMESTGFSLPSDSIDEQLHVDINQPDDQQDDMDFVQ